jgi:hypothetical protein
MHHAVYYGVSQSNHDLPLPLRFSFRLMIHVPIPPVLQTDDGTVKIGYTIPQFTRFPYEQVHTSHPRPCRVRFKGSLASADLSSHVVGLRHHRAGLRTVVEGEPAICSIVFVVLIPLPFMPLTAACFQITVGVHKPQVPCKPGPEVLRRASKGRICGQSYSTPPHGGG